MIKIIILVNLLLISVDESNQKRDGYATIYHNKFEGRKTACGEIFSQKKLTAASNFYKLGTRVVVRNIKTNEIVRVVINDRMATSMSAKNRIVDLSLAAAKKIGFDFKQGIVRVEVYKE